MRIGVYANPNRPHAVELARRVAQRTGGRVDVVTIGDTPTIDGTAGPVPLEALEADLVVALGGDGTFLSVLQRSSLPLFPINAGHVGFLAEVNGADPAGVDAAVERLVSGRYTVEERMKLSASVGGQQLADATNEVVVHTSQVAKMREFEIAIDRAPVGRIRADGIILATPTGSTSYALSTMGPVVDPTVEGIVVVGIAPFLTPPRAVVVDPMRTISVRLVAPDKDGVIVIDGQSETRLRGGEGVLVYRAARPARFVRLGAPFFLRWQGRNILPWGTPPADG
ncbi:MAG TPA: NAD(+)/NADH kinase [Thermoplasmata archaeon]|nr:NAD(+)/NADH kinase [Thermoplasmata archaeon]